MKLRTLLKIAYTIISIEHENVIDEYRSDDGTLTPQNRKEALELQATYADWMLAAERVLGSEMKKHVSRKKPAPRGVVQKPRRIVVVK